MSKNDGGAAFPNTPTDRSGQIAEHECGMSLRDYFAAKAMQGLLSQGADDEDNQLHSKGLLGEVVAENAYHFADAMLAERNKQ